MPNRPGDPSRGRDWIRNKYKRLRPMKKAIEHIRHLKDLHIKGRAERPEWVRRMATIRRKTLVVCRTCLKRQIRKRRANSKDMWGGSRLRVGRRWLEYRNPLYWTLAGTEALAQRYRQQLLHTREAPTTNVDSGRSQQPKGDKEPDKHAPHHNQVHEKHRILALVRGPRIR